MVASYHIPSINILASRRQGAQVAEVSAYVVERDPVRLSAHVILPICNLTYDLWSSWISGVLDV